MSFGNFLLGVAEGLDRGIDAGDRISGAMDRKRVRDAGKKAGSQAPAGTTPPIVPAPTGTMPPPINGKPAYGPPAPAQPAAPLVDPGRTPPPATGYAARPPAASLQPTYTPAATMGVQGPTFAAQFPGAAMPARTLGVMGYDPYATLDQPY